MNHRWKNDTCIHCGLKREKREQMIWVRDYSYLSKWGVWEDASIHHFKMNWWYGTEHKFQRPNCINNAKNTTTSAGENTISKSHAFPNIIEKDS